MAGDRAPGHRALAGVGALELRRELRPHPQGPGAVALQPGLSDGEGLAEGLAELVVSLQEGRGGEGGVARCPGRVDGHAEASGGLRGPCLSRDHMIGQEGLQGRPGVRKRVGGGEVCMHGDSFVRTGGELKGCEREELGARCPCLTAGGAAILALAVWTMSAGV